MSKQATRLGRRRLLRAVVSSAGALPLMSACQSQVMDPFIPAADREVASQVAVLYFEGADVEHARRIGDRYLNELREGGEASVDAALDAILRAVHEAPDPAAAVEALEAEVVDDFAALRVVDLSGWTLSRTELALCALLALT